MVGVTCYLLLLVSCDGGKTKSTPSPTDLEWTVRLDWSLTISTSMLQHLCSVWRVHWALIQRGIFTDILILQFFTFLKDVTVDVYNPYLLL